MTWKTVLKKEIENNHLDLGTFTLQELINYSLNVLQLKYPDNDSCEASIRANLQKLRNENYLIFVERGTYKVLSKENDEFINFVDTYHKNQL